MKDQITMTLSDVKKQAMSILAAKVGGSSLIPQLKHHRRYANRDRKVAHLMLWYDYFNDNYVYPYHTSTGDTVYRELIF
jgi:hypothetical protein